MQTKPAEAPPKLLRRGRVATREDGRSGGGVGEEGGRRGRQGDASTR